MDSIVHILASANECIYCNSEHPTLVRAKLWEMPASAPEYGAWAEKVMFIVRVVGVGSDNGSGEAATSPAEWSLGVKFVYEVPHTEHEQYLIPAWQALDATSVSTDIFEGQPWSFIKDSHDAGVSAEEGGYGVVATQASTLPLGVKRTITNFGRDVKILLNPWASGEKSGNNPYINATVLAIAMT